MTVAAVGIIGAGQMGRGIAQVCAQSGFRVYLYDIKEDALAAAVAHISGGYDKLIAKNKLTAEAKAAALASLTTSTDLAAFNHCDLVIEAATENETIKIQILKSLLPHLKTSALIGSNTSSIPITRLAAVTDRPDRFVGIHFMNPVPVMQLVELIRGIATSDETFSSARTFAERLGKTVAVAADYPAFIVNRILMPMINEAVQTLYEGVGDVASIDSAMKLGTNQPMGPLELADFIGLDTCLAIMRVLHDGFADSKYRPAPLLVKYVEAGWLGRKTGKGFYDYSSGKPVPTR